MLHLTRLVAFVFAALFAIAPVQAADERHAYTQAHVLRLTGAEDIHGLNPHLESQLVLSYLSSMTMAWLYKTGPNAEPVPELLTVVPTQENGLISKDGKTITWKLRRGVKWSDGVPFDADDVVFSVKTVLNDKNNENSRDGFNLIQKMDEPDKFTVVLHLKKPYSPHAVVMFSSAGANPCVLPKHLLEKYETINEIPYNSLPVGIGPFRYKEWRRGDAIELEANPFYFRGKPKLEKVIYKIIPDRNTTLTQLQTHELDLWIPISAAFYERVSAIPGITVGRQPAFTYDHIDFNLSHPVVADPAVRQALRLAIDRKTINEKIRRGLGTLSDSVLSPKHQAYHPIPLTPFDLAKARKLLDAAGWVPGADGIRAKNGVRLVLDYASGTGTPDTDAQIELIRANWKEIGVGMEVKHYPPSLFFGPLASGGIIYSGKFDVANFAWSADSFGDLSVLFGCNDVPPNGQNVVHWCNRRADAAMEQFKLEYDAKKRNVFDAIVTEELNKDVPTIVLDIRDDIFGYNSDLKHWKPNSVAPFDDMMNVDI